MANAKRNEWLWLMQMNLLECLSNIIAIYLQLRTLHMVQLLIPFAIIRY